MKLILILIYSILISFFSTAQQVPILKIAELEKRFNSNSDTTYIVNFWATWCLPCIKELPDFDSIHTEYKHKKVKVLLVSIDFKEDLETKLLPFLINKKIKSEVVLLDEVNGNYFIPKISEQWTGAIPATLIINNQKKTHHFFEKKLNYEFLKTEIESIK